MSYEWNRLWVWEWTTNEWLGRWAMNGTDCEAEQWMGPTVRLSNGWDWLRMGNEWDWPWRLAMNGTDCEVQQWMGLTLEMSNEWDWLWEWAMNETDCEDEGWMGLSVRMSDEWDCLWGWAMNGTVCEDERRMGLTVWMISNREPSYYGRQNIMPCSHCISTVQRQTYEHLILIIAKRIVSK
jgi:hypothetical protein